MALIDINIAEVENTHYDEIKQAYAIDVFKVRGQGCVACWVNPTTKQITWENARYKKSELVKEAINQILN